MKTIGDLKRKIIFTTLLLVFLFLVPFILMISLGYKKFDDAFSFTKTGGIYIQSKVLDTSVFLNGEYFKNNSFLTRNTLIQKLKPNQYHKIEVFKDGFQSWIKEIYVYPGLVSEGYVLMLPDIIEKTEIFPFFDKEGNGVSSPIVGFTKIAKTKSGRIIPENQKYIDVVTLFEGENPYEVKVPEIIKSTGAGTTTDEKNLPEHYVKLGINDPEDLFNLIESSYEISWLENGNITLNWIGKIENIPFYYCDGFEEKICKEDIILDWGDPILKFDYLPGRNDVWIVLVSSGIYAVEVDPRSQRNIQRIYLGENLDFEISENGRILIKDKGSYFELAL
jgi:hypothetical protein